MSTKLNPVALHYFRLPRHTWELALTRMKQLGADAIYTPVVWGFHELADNRFDLLGLTNPRRNLAGFVDLCLAMGFQPILDFSPGMLPEARLLNGGLPGWLWQQHPEIMATDSSGNPTAMPSPENPALLKLAGRWFQAVGQALAAKQQVNAQVSIRLPAPNFSDHITRVQWPIWLRKRYAEGGVAALNAAYAPATPYRSLNQVELIAPADNSAFQQDVKAFTADLLANTRLTYASMLQEQGFTVTDPIAPPLHGVEINPDSADVGAALRWATEAPVRADGEVNPAFWQLKARNLQNVVAAEGETQIIYSADPAVKPIKLTAGPACFRLLLNGKIEAAPVTKRGETTKLAYLNADKAGQTDFYFTLPAEDAPITGYTAAYLAALLTARNETVGRSLAALNHLADALATPPSPAVAPSTPALSEAQASISQAHQALHKATASIGALEDVFATALNKSVQVETPLVVPASDAAKLGPVKEACREAAAHLQAVRDPVPPAPLTVKSYTAARSIRLETAQAVMARLEMACLWLREGISRGTLPANAWAVHARIESVLLNLSAGSDAL